MKLVVTALVKTRDVIEANDYDQAEKRFSAKYPSMIDKDSRFLSVEKLVHPGNVVVITTSNGLEDRTGWLGIVISRAYMLYPGMWDLLIKEYTEDGHLVTYHDSGFEVIDRSILSTQRR